jgi:thiamine pyrophosphate-dependent acetolactate synthase large subunit-like protein
MTISELSTAVQYSINTITFVMNNNSWGAEKSYQRDFYGERYIGADIDSPPFHKVAELYGAKGFHIEKISDLKNAVLQALKCEKPVVINVEVDPDAIYSFRRDSFKRFIYFSSVDV